ncbi:ThiF family adenylyltransferase [Micromonospora palomenae]|uniref:ThiF family adenylyltransferase n=1 Tax=Micromonospora palomenae TaxID=1461247 RepID=UPI003F8C9102
MTHTTEEGSDPADDLRIGRAVARDVLLDVLARARFRRVAGPEDRWRGALTFQRTTGAETETRTTVVDIVIPDDFPYIPPTVHPLGRAWAEQMTGRVFADYYEAGNGWHRDLDQALCLFVEADRTRLPWADGEQLLEQTRAWLARDADGWSDDEPALDLDRYLRRSTQRALILYGELAGFQGKVLRLRRERHDVLRVGAVAAPRRQGRQNGRRVWQPDTVLVLDAGNLRTPIRDWNDLRAAVGADRANTLTRAHQDGLSKVLLIYRRRDVQGILGLALERGKDGGITLASLATAPDDLATRSIRAHPEAEVLGTKRVAIVGVGAVGSVVADLLHRSGVGELFLLDGDLVLPGNTTRHLLDEDAVGLPKARAVAEALHGRRPRFGTVSWRDGSLESVDDALSLLAGHDVVVDATADSAATAILTAAARAGAGQLLSVCVLADGYAVRVDRSPVREGKQPLPRPQLPLTINPIYETGCGSPISTTPPAAVWEAASIATRHTIGLLLDPAAVAPGEERILGRGLDQ